ncbi:MAG: hypothetical protein U1C73_21630, partial [Dietzia sp.]|nr:hypothetical protein [Dietzia sp.]
QGHPISLMNMGGGFGIHYKKQEAQPAQAFAEVLVPAVQRIPYPFVVAGLVQALYLPLPAG